MGPLSKRSWPRSPQKISKPAPPGCKKPGGAFLVSFRSTTRASSPNATAPFDPLFARTWPIVPCSWLPCSATRVFSPGDLLRMIWSTWLGILGGLPNFLDTTPATLKSSHIVVFVFLSDPYVRSCQVQAHAAMDGGVGVGTEMPYRNVRSGAQVSRYCVSFCRQPRLTINRSKRQLACCCLDVWPSARQRRPDGWTSTPRASRGATAETTPKALLLLSSAS